MGQEEKRRRLRHICTCNLGLGVGDRGLGFRRPHHTCTCMPVLATHTNA
jgi:hypothetical protein